MEQTRVDLEEFDFVEVVYKGLIINIYPDPDKEGDILTQAESEEGGKRIMIKPLPDNQSIISYGFMPDKKNSEEKKARKSSGKLKLIDPSKK